jgi:cytidine deaminase
MVLLIEQEDALVGCAQSYKEKAYVPYSHFRVGAAVLTKEGTMYGGCNIENASYGATNCAERTAIFKAVSEGFKDIMAMAIVGDNQDFIFPCGICRQVLVEFGEDTLVVLVDGAGQRKRLTIKELLPHSFTNKDLKEKTHGI